MFHSFPLFFDYDVAKEIKSSLSPEIDSSHRRWRRERKSFFSNFFTDLPAYTVYKGKPRDKHRSNGVKNPRAILEGRKDGWIGCRGVLLTRQVVQDKKSRDREYKSSFLCVSIFLSVPNAREKRSTTLFHEKVSKKERKYETQSCACRNFKFVASPAISDRVIDTCSLPFFFSQIGKWVFAFAFGHKLGFPISDGVRLGARVLSKKIN